MTTAVRNELPALRRAEQRSGGTPRPQPVEHSGEHRGGDDAVRRDLVRLDEEGSVRLQVQILLLETRRT
jgi:hypothetical protein